MKHQVTKTNLKILFQNVRSLHLHIEDVACDYSVQAAHVNIFVETALCSRDIDEAVVDLPASAREHTCMHYVGLSRLQNISGLHILNLKRKR